MTDAKSAWVDTGEQLSSLGSKLGAHYEKQRGTEGAQARAETEEALKRVGQAVQDAFEAVGAAAKDEAVRQDVKQVGRSLVGALELTFRQVSGEIQRAFDRSAQDRTDQPAQDPKPQDPQDPTPQDPKPEDPKL
jgi:hypothetical protein